MRHWLVALPVLLASPAASWRTAPEPPPRADFSVLTYNLNYGLAGDVETLEAIGAPGADLVFLQETTPAWEEAIRLRYGDRYPTMQFVTRGGAGGMAVLSRLPLLHAVTTESAAGWFPSLRVVVAIDPTPIQVVSVHLRPPYARYGGFLTGYFTTSGHRRREVEVALRHLDPDLPTLVVGDFNEGSGPALGWVRYEGMTCALHTAEPSAHTWHWTWPVIGTASAKLDHVFHDDRLTPVEARVVEAGASDHLPVYAAFALVP